VEVPSSVDGDNDIFIGSCSTKNPPKLNKKNQKEVIVGKINIDDKESYDFAKLRVAVASMGCLMNELSPVPQIVGVTIQFASTTLEFPTIQEDNGTDMGIALPLETLRGVIKFEDVYAPMPFTDFHDMKESSSGALLVIASVRIPSLNLNLRTIIHGVPGLTTPTVGRFFVLDAIPRVVCGPLCTPLDFTITTATQVLPGQTYFLDAVPYDIASTRFKTSPSAQRMKKDALECSKIGTAHYKVERFIDALGWFQVGYMYLSFAGSDDSEVATAAYNVAACFARMVKDKHAILWADRTLAHNNTHAKASALKQRLSVPISL